MNMRIRAAACRVLLNPAALFGLLLLAAALSLAAAYVAEFVYGLTPCILCLYQRAPFAAVIVLAFAGLFLHKNKSAAAALLALCALALALNAGIAFYHTGVELHWWLSAVEGCAVPAAGDTPDSLLAAILRAPAVPCTEIAWRDPVFGFTMANYNIVWCAGLALLCLPALFRPCPKAG